ncbi:neuropeptides capa receptor-like isoform X2 [Ostrinia furnacalis]|uniref:neuropeptides capa receptor-like isoform X2 n=1 Tax=Ostrinia furnacalis TaxID=93504 RepID=UPI00103CDF4B|nr:neuropeptides capa receptor-like isoform X2 [Ostrinia furnacalis]
MSNETSYFYDFDINEWAELLAKTVKERPEWVRLMFMALMLTVFAVGLVGNLLTCAVIYCDKSMHTATNYYLFNLGISDFILAFGILLELRSYRKAKIDTVADYVYVYSEVGDLICKLHSFITLALMNNGILNLTVLAIERYIAIWHPLLLNRKPIWRRVMKVIACIWILAILEALPEIWTIALIKTNKLAICFIVPTTFARILNGVLALVTFVIPLGIMVFVYSMIAFKVNVTPRKNSRDKIFNQRNNRSRVHKLIALTVSFLVCWLPYFTLRLLIFASNMRHTPWYAQNWDVLLMVTSFNSWFSIVLNPMLCSLMSTKFRRSLQVKKYCAFLKIIIELPKEGIEPTTFHDEV